MSENSLKTQLQSYGLSKILKMINKDPEKNLPKIMEWADRLLGEESLTQQRNAIRKVIYDHENIWHQYMMSFWTDVDDSVRLKAFENFIINANVIAAPKQDKARVENNCNTPWAILLDPTSACNLSCTGCWAAEYGNNLSLSYEELDSIITQGKSIGVYMYIYSGGEPLVRKKDIIRLCEAHDDCMFLAFTNGTLIDEAFAQEMLRVGNFAPAISIEGFEEATDSRRGSGTFQKVVRALDILKKHRLFYGASLCYTSQNSEVIGSEEFIDFIIEKGCKFAWFFTFMPVGVGAPVDLIATPEQREYMYRQIRAFRETKPLFTMDFWNDGEYVHGCIAGGRFYLHINANGDIEPCAFIHYSDSNIREKTIVEALSSPLFMQYKENQPFNVNHLRPCPLLDNPEKLASMVHVSGAHSTDLCQPENVDTLCSKCKDASDNWAVTADRLWAIKQDRIIKEEREKATVDN